MGSIDRCHTEERLRRRVVTRLFRATSWQSFSRRLGKFIREQVLNLFRKGDPDEPPVPLQKSELKMETLLRRQRGRSHHLEPAQAILRILKNLPKGSDRVGSYSDRAWRWSI